MIMHAVLVAGAVLLVFWHYNPPRNRLTFTARNLTTWTGWIEYKIAVYVDLTLKVKSSLQLDA